MTPLDSRRFRDALGWFATGVTIITAAGEGGEPVGFTANSFSSVSLEPPLILFSLDRAAQCLPVFETAKHFAVNVLAESQQDLSNRFAAAVEDRFRDLAFTRGEGGTPLLADSLAIFECAAHAVHDGGDHRIFLGRVLRFRAKDEGDPLLYCRGRYRKLGPPLGWVDDAVLETELEDAALHELDSQISL